MSKETKRKEEAEQEETVEFMDEQVEAATVCGPDTEPKKAKLSDEEMKEQAEADALMGAEIEAATVCPCDCKK